MIYVLLADGFEEIEALATVDFLRRAELPVTMAGVNGLEAIGSHSITVACDCLAEEIENIGKDDTVVLPGGMPGTLNLERSQTVQNLIDEANDEGRLLCAICAAPSILGHKGLLGGKEAICFPGFESELYGAEISRSKVCRDGKIITAAGAGVAIDFGMEIAAEYIGRDAAAKIKESLQCM